jgi:PEGA domain
MKRSNLLACVLLLALLLPVAVSAVGNISVTSNPAGATIVLDGVSTSYYTPTTIENVTNATHMIVLQLSGYQDFVQTNLQVNDNRTSQVSATLVNLTSSVSFSSVPTGASVYVDGVATGTTNTSAISVGYGSHIILLKLSGYTDWSRNVILNASTFAVSATLTNTTTVANGSIYFSSSPSQASVYLNNTLVGTTAFTLYNVTPGDYRVLMEESGYHPYTDTITVTAGNQATFYGKLVEVPVETTTATATPVITTYTPVPTAKVTTIPVPTSWPSDTPTPASPVGPLAIVGAVGIAVLAMRK